MKRFAVLALAGWCLLAPGNRAQAQTLKEHSLSDTQSNAKPPSASAPAQSAAPSQQPPAVVQPAPAPQGAGTSAPAPQAQTPQTQPLQQPMAAPQAPPAAPAPSVPPEQTPPAQTPPPPGGSTPINGSTNLSPPPPPPPPATANTYSRSEIDHEVMGFFESGSRGLAEIVAKAFREQGQPAGFIKGNEGGGALFLGFRYGAGTLYLRGQPPVPVYWQSPSLGFDLGVNAGKVFTLVYNLQNPNEIFQRFPAVDGSVYIIGGFGMNYQRSGNITLAPIRFGVGLRLGINAGYQHYTQEKSINPF